jgi:hypothetical protein
MSFILVDLANDERDCQINGWNWRPTLEIIRGAGVLSEEQLERMSGQGAGGVVAAEQARAIASFLQSEILPKLSEGQRMHADGSISAVPNTPRPIAGADPQDLYAARLSWLEAFAEFCRTCNGFKVC